MTVRAWTKRVRIVFAASPWSCIDFTHASRWETRSSASATSVNGTVSMMLSIWYREPGAHTCRGDHSR